MTKQEVIQSLEMMLEQLRHNDRADGQFCWLTRTHDDVTGQDTVDVYEDDGHGNGMGIATMNVENDGRSAGAWLAEALREWNSQHPELDVTEGG